MAGTFRWVMYAVVMPVISLLGLIGNVTSICVLRHRDIQLKKYFVDVLSALACFDILFLLTNFILITFPNWGIWEEYDRVWTDTWNTFPILVILLYPAWYIFMAASIYMTVTVAVNRCLEIRMLRGNVPRSLRSFLNSGVAQSLAVFLWANVFILPRWFEYKIVDTVNVKNVTLEDNVTIVEVNETVAGIDYTWLRKNDNYNLYYWGIMNPTCFLVIPLTIMVVSTILMLRQLRAVTASLSAAVIQRNHEKRNRSISVMLIGIITLFVICHLGKVIFSCYQLWGGIAVYNEQWVKNLIIVNDTLAVSNSSLNFAIYCKDLLFRQCAGKVYHKFLQCPQCPTDKNAGKSETFVMGETSRSSDATPLQSPEMTR